MNSKQMATAFATIVARSKYRKIKILFWPSG
jgi:hypothetical protein